MEAHAGKSSIPPYQNALAGVFAGIFLEWWISLCPPGHWMGDILKVIFYGDQEAAERLLSNFYREQILFHEKRRPFFKYWMNKRLREQGYEGGIYQYQQIWMDVAIPAMLLALSVNWKNDEEGKRALEFCYYMAMAIGESAQDDSFLIEFHTFIFQLIRSEVRKHIEFDITDGATLDQLEVKNINADDTRGVYHPDLGPGRELPYIHDPERVMDWMQSFMNDLHGEDIRPIETDNEELNTNFIVEKLLEGVSIEDRLILLCPQGEMQQLAKRLGRTPNALYQRKNVLIKKLIKKTKSPPKIQLP